MSDELTKYGYTQEGKVYLKGYMDFKDREIGVVRESEEQSLQYFVDRFKLAEKKIEEVKNAVASYPNKGSYLMKIIHLRTYLANFSGLGDFESLFKELNVLEDEINIFVDENRKRNTETKKELLKEAEAIVDSDDWSEATQQLKDIKLKWIKTGSAFQEVDSVLNERFDNALDEFFRKRKDHFKNMRKSYSKRREQYKELILKIRDINDVEYATPQLDREVDQIKYEWEKIGKVQRSKYDRLIRTFEKEIEFYYLPQDEKERVRKETERKTGIELKKELYEMVVAMLNEEEISIARIKRIQKRWKKIGRLQDREDKDINLNFRIICNEIFETHFLNLEAREKNPDYDRLGTIDQLKVKIRLIRDSLKKDETELGMFNNKFKHVMNTEGQDSPHTRDMIKQRGGYINKIKTKQRILRKLQDTLLRSY